LALKNLQASTGLAVFAACPSQAARSCCVKDLNFTKEKASNNRMEIHQNELANNSNDV